MNIDKFKHQHAAILADIAALRRHVQGGIAANAELIAQRIVAMSGNIKLHLAVEDRVLYPTLRTSGDLALARMSAQYQGEMDGIVAAYMAFAARWNTASRVADEPDAFRADANTVLRTLYERMRREDREFYPAVEAMDGERLAA